MILGVLSLLFLRQKDLAMRNNSQEEQFFCINSTLSPGQTSCATKVDKNRTVMSYRYADEVFGFCPAACKGEILHPDSKFNLGLVGIILNKMSQESILY